MQQTIAAEAGKGIGVHFTGNHPQRMRRATEETGNQTLNETDAIAAIASAGRREQGSVLWRESKHTALSRTAERAPYFLAAAEAVAVAVVEALRAAAAAAAVAGVLRPNDTTAR